MRGLHEKRCGDSGSGVENEGDAWIGGVEKRWWRRHSNGTSAEEEGGKNRRPISVSASARNTGIKRKATTTNQ